MSDAVRIDFCDCPSTSEVSRRVCRIVCVVCWNWHCRSSRCQEARGQCESDLVFHVEVCFRLTQIWQIREMTV